MKKIIRLTESDLIRLVRRVINEQTDNVEPLSNKSEGTEIDGITYKLPQIKDEDSLDSFIFAYATNENMSKNEFFTNIFGENTENFKLAKKTSTVFNRLRDGMNDLQNVIYLVVEILLRLNAMSGQKTPLTLQQAKTLIPQIDFTNYNASDDDWPINEDFDFFDKCSDFLVKNGLDSDVFKYYSKVLQSRLS